MSLRTVLYLPITIGIAAATVFDVVRLAIREARREREGVDSPHSTTKVAASPQDWSVN